MRTYDQVLVDVDTQFDFLDPAGNLCVPDAMAVHPALERLFEFARRTGVPVISTADEHSAHDPEFERFGRHCEAGTLGQHKLPFTVLPKSRMLRANDELPARPDALLREYQQIVFPKASLDVFANPRLGEMVDSLQVGEYLVFGVCTEYCIATAVEGLLARGAKVAIVTDAIRPLDEAKGAEVLKRFADRGVRLVHTAQVVHSAEEEPVSTGTGDDVDDAL